MTALIGWTLTRELHPDAAKQEIFASSQSDERRLLEDCGVARKLDNDNYNVKTEPPRWTDKECRALPGVVVAGCRWPAQHENVVCLFGRGGSGQLRSMTV